MTGRRVLLIGGTGVFGERLARHLAGFDGLDLMLSSRDAAKARALAAGIEPAQGTRVSGLGLDHRHDLPARLAELAPWLVIDASGPFQGAGYEVPRAALQAGAHVVDLADARDYILGYGTALDAVARTRGLTGLAGASSTPALSAAAVDAITSGWQRIDTIDIAIAPGGRSDVGRAVIEAILSYAGRPIPIWREGAPQQADGWIESRLVTMPGLGRRKLAAVETVDALELGPSLDVRSRVAFSAGLESPLEQAGIMALARLRRAGLVDGLSGLVPLLLAARRITRLPTSDRGGMLVEATGLGPDGSLRTARWSLLAQRGDGPQVPTLPAAAAVRALLAGSLEPGAGSASRGADAGSDRGGDDALRDHDRAHSRGPGAGAGRDGAGRRGIRRTARAAQGVPWWRRRAGLARRSRDRHRIRPRRALPAPHLRPAGQRHRRADHRQRRSHRKAGSPAEVWTRNFGGTRFSSTLSLGRDGQLRETFGPIAFSLDLARTDGGLQLPVSAGRIMGLRLPGGLLPRSEAREECDQNGRFRFDVRLTLPFFGLLTHYRGWLAPASDQCCASCSIVVPRRPPATQSLG